MAQKKDRDFIQAVLNCLETNPALMVQAVEWLGNHYQLAKSLTGSDAPKPVPGDFLKELWWAKLTEDYAYIALLCLLKLRQDEETDEKEEQHEACDPGADLSRRGGLPAE